MKYSVIIPTMFFHIEQLNEMLAVYNGMKCVGEILVINNDKSKAVNFAFDKVKMIGDGVNKLVNPSWAFGVENAKYENIVIANDDITIKGDSTKLFELASILISNDDRRILGPSKFCFAQFGKLSNVIGFAPSVSPNKFTINYGFGVLMFMKKHIFQTTKIPNDFKIWYGDHILYLVNNPWEFVGVEIVTAMRGTTSKINLGNAARTEWLAFNKIKHGR